MTGGVQVACDGEGTDNEILKGLEEMQRNMHINFRGWGVRKVNMKMEKCLTGFHFENLIHRCC